MRHSGVSAQRLDGCHCFKTSGYQNLLPTAYSPCPTPPSPFSLALIAEPALALTLVDAGVLIAALPGHVVDALSRPGDVALDRTVASLVGFSSSRSIIPPMGSELPWGLILGSEHATTGGFRFSLDVH